MKKEDQKKEWSDADRRPGRYDFARIEAKWQRYWEQRQTFRTPNPGEAGFDESRPKFYVLDMFPYPSGAGLHVGHPLGYCATDIIARYKRMRGFNVLHPMGFDAFGLPAEQYAIETNVHPAVTTRKNIDGYRRQLQMFGFSYDWSREVATCDPSYYKWTQWMFARMFESWYDDAYKWRAPDGRQVKGRARPIRELVEELESGRRRIDADLTVHLVVAPSRDPNTPPVSPLAKGGGVARAEVRSSKATGKVLREWSNLSEVERRKVIDGQRLAYRDEIPVNWCPALGTVLANEEVDNDGRSERGGHPVFRRPLKQWMLRITKYAERLLTDLDELVWPEPIKLMQRNWVGRSTGAEVVFPLADRWVIENGQWQHFSSNCKQDGVARTGARGSSSRGASDGPALDWPDSIRIYTTRPDTLFGATYMVLAPEHPLVETITTPEHRAAVDQYVEAAKRKSDLARTAESKEKTGVFTGTLAINPVNGRRIPIWVADYVLMGYGTGAIMAVPGSDTRDFEFACAFDLPIVAVVRPTAAWIETRIDEMASGIESAAARGFEDALQAYPELRDEIESSQRQSAGLGGKTLAVLRERVGIEKLIEHYVRHPRAWGAAFVEEESAVNSPGADVETEPPGGLCPLNSQTTVEAQKRITEWLESNGVGRGAVNFKLRDWLFSRQRYWGEPFPIMHGEDGETVAVDENELPVELPEMEDFRPTPSLDNAESLPSPPLSRAKKWIDVSWNGKHFRRDVNTMPQWAGSCWYYLRFIDPSNDNSFCSPGAEKYWMPVDLYVGGAEHAVLHLLYARFWHKVLFDLGYVSTREPFQRLFNQGMIQGFAFRDQRGLTVGPDVVEEHGDDRFSLKATGEPVSRIVAKMSKSLKNVVNPDEIICEYGADTFRLYEMYMGPLDASKPWNTRDVPGLFKLCQRIWRLFVDESTGTLSALLTDDEADDLSKRALHKMILRVTTELEQLKLNTAIAAIFDFVNAMTPMERRTRAVLEPFVLVLAPFAPHLAEELWARLGHESSLAYEAWPTCDERLARDESVEIAVQVNGRIKARVMVSSDADEVATESAARADEKVMAAIAGKTVRKVIVVKGRLVNFIM